MEPERPEPSAKYRRMEPPIRLDQLVESVDVAEHPDDQDDSYRDQQWLIRNAIG